jgi:hypothetical protein
VILAGPFAAVAGLLAVAGALKLLAPAAGAPLGLAATRAAGALELALGVAALVHPQRLVTALVAVAFAGFAAYSLRLVTAGAASDCGCFGVESSRPGIGHVLLDLACTAIAAAATVAPPRTVASLVAGAPLTGLVVAAGVAGVVYATYLAYNVLPRAWRAYEA